MRASPINRIREREWNVYKKYRERRKTESQITEEPLQAGEKGKGKCSNNTKVGRHEDGKSKPYTQGEKEKLTLHNIEIGPPDSDRIPHQS